MVSRFTKSMAEMRRVLAAERQIWRMYGSKEGFVSGVEGVRERIIRLWSVISVAK